MARVVPKSKVKSSKSTVITVPRNSGTTPLSTKKDMKKKTYGPKIIGRV